jgi:hypothetical protein
VSRTIELSVRLGTGTGTYARYLKIEVRTTTLYHETRMQPKVAWRREDKRDHNPCLKSKTQVTKPKPRAELKLFLDE